MGKDKQKNALSVYNTLLAMMDEKKLKYNRFDDDLVITFTMGGEDIPMDIVAGIDAERELVRLFSPLPFKFSREKLVEGAIATSQINYKLVDGCFDFNCKDGAVSFRMTSSFAASLISKSLFEYMVACLCYTVDKYNDKLMLLNKGLIPLEDFFK